MVKEEEGITLPTADAVMCPLNATFSSSTTTSTAFTSKDLTTPTTGCMTSASPAHRYNFIKVVICMFTVIYLTGSAADACSCILSHPQEHYCSADFVAVMHVKRQNKPLAGKHMASYSIKVRKEFKMTAKAQEALDHGVIYSSTEETSCGRKFEPNTRYLITGRIVAGKAWVSICNFVEEWATLTVKQRKGFRKLYASGCRCNVREEPPVRSFYAYKQSHLPGHLSKTHHRPGYCHWQTKWDGMLDCQGMYSICAPAVPGFATTADNSNFIKTQSLKAKKPSFGSKSRKSQVQESLPLESKQGGLECQWVHSHIYRNCMKTRKFEKEREKKLEREWEP